MGVMQAVVNMGAGPAGSLVLIAIIAGMSVAGDVPGGERGFSDAGVGASREVKITVIRSGRGEKETPRVRAGMVVAKGEGLMKPSSAGPKPQLGAEAAGPGKVMAHLEQALMD